MATAETDNQLNEEQGADEYRNVAILWSLDTPTLAMWEKLRALQPASADADVKVDILDGLIVALDLLFRRTDGKKYEKRLLVITDAAEKITDAGDVDSVVQMIQNMGVKLQIMCVCYLALGVRFLRYMLKQCDAACERTVALTSATRPTR